MLALQVWYKIKTADFKHQMCAGWLTTIGVQRENDV